MFNLLANPANLDSVCQSYKAVIQKQQIWKCDDHNYDCLYNYVMLTQRKLFAITLLLS